MTRAQRSVRWLFAAFIVLNALAVTYPGITLVNHIRPFVLGLPFVFFWVALWVVLGLVILIVCDIVESRGEQ